MELVKYEGHSKAVVRQSLRAT